VKYVNDVGLIIWCFTLTVLLVTIIILSSFKISDRLVVLAETILIQKQTSNNNDVQAADEPAVVININ